MYLTAARARAAWEMRRVRVIVSVFRASWKTRIKVDVCVGGVARVCG